MNKDKVLPIARVLDVANVTPYISGWAVGMAEQRDADLVILGRDYVPKEQVKALVEAAKILKNYLLGIGLKPRDRIVKEALAQLEGEVQP